MEHGQRGEPTTTVRFPKRLHRALKVAAANSDLTIQTFVEELFSRHQNENVGLPGSLGAPVTGLDPLRPEERRMIRSLLRLMRDEANPARESLLRAIRALLENPPGSRRT